MKEIIKLENIKRDFKVGDETVHALRGVSFTIYEGEFVTIMGTSGSGKSTLLNSLGCLDTPTSGEYYLDGTSAEDAIEEIKKNNLFQYPTERLVARMVRSCYKRLDALDDEQLRQELSSAPPEIAKQINLYAMMRYNRIVWDFMVGVVGEKFRSQDFEFSRKDLNVFFSHLQEQNDDIAGWSESTVNKIKQVLTKILVEVEILDTFKSTRLNPLILCEALEEGIRRNNYLEAVAAFNCFR